MELTGFSRTTISETISNLTDVMSKYPVHQTRKPGDKKKYYYCPLDIEQYIRTFFMGALELSEFKIDFIPQFLHRLDALIPQNADIMHVKQFLINIFVSIKYYIAFIEQSDHYLLQFAKNPDYIPDFNLNEDELFKITNDNETDPNTDSLRSIKIELIEQMKDNATAFGIKKELIAIIYALLLENKPVTQDYLIELTNYSRTVISDSLSRYSKLNVVQVVKKPKDRKKYYQIQRRENYSFAKLQRLKQSIAQINMMIHTKFLPDLNRIEASMSEKEKLESFFYETIRSYQLFDDYSTLFFNFMQKKMERHDISWS